MVSVRPVPGLPMSLNEAFAAKGSIENRGASPRPRKQPHSPTQATEREKGCFRSPELTPLFLHIESTRQRLGSGPSRALPEFVVHQRSLGRTERSTRPRRLCKLKG